MSFLRDFGQKYPDIVVYGCHLMSHLLKVNSAYELELVESRAFSGARLKDESERVGIFIASVDIIVAFSHLCIIVPVILEVLKMNYCTHVKAASSIIELITTLTGKSEEYRIQFDDSGICEGAILCRFGKYINSFNSFRCFMEWRLLDAVIVDILANRRKMDASVITLITGVVKILYQDEVFRHRIKAGVSEGNILRFHALHMAWGYFR